MQNNYSLEEKYSLIKEFALKSKEKDPIRLIKDIMHNDFVNIHGPEHHFLDGLVFMLILHNNGLDFDLISSVEELEKRTIKMPGAMCGYWGVCGSVASIGAVFSIIDKTGPLSNSIDYAEHMEFTSSVIKKMSEIGGPRCCKRNAFLSIREGVEYANLHYNLNIKISDDLCEFSSLNLQCLKSACPFHKI